MTTTQDAPLAAPEFYGISVEMVAENGDDPAGQATQALNTTLQALAIEPRAGWQTRPVHDRLPLWFDLVPPPDHTITVSQGFDLQYHLQGLDAVRDAEALFETTLDNIPDTNTVPSETSGLESLSTPIANLLPEESSRDWSLKLIEVPAAWNLSDPDKSQGNGIRIGHPDSGYLVHPDFTDHRLQHDLERDFYDTDASALNPQDRGGGHGLGTGSVIISNKQDPQDNRFIMGVAPRAKIVPMRIVQKGPPLFFYRSGPHRVREAVFHAIDSGCHVISMSMGGIWHRGLERALRMAYENNILLIAAAGNVVRMVVWPARYKEVIAVAGCTARRERWINSSRGASVDITTPGHNIWRAVIVDKSAADSTDTPDVQPGSGTSYATAITAGVAALWLAHHGREQLLDKYQGVPLNEVFRHMLRVSADPPPAGHDGKWGGGIINARRLLATPLPPRSTFAPAGLESLVEPAAPAVPQFSTVFEEVPAETLRGRLSATMGLTQEEVDGRLSAVEPELLFHVITNPALRARYQQETSGLEVVSMEATPQQLQTELLAVPGLSSRLRNTIRR
jgi:thermitase